MSQPQERDPVNDPLFFPKCCGKTVSSPLPTKDWFYRYTCPECGQKFCKSCAIEPVVPKGDECKGCTDDHDREESHLL